MPETDWRRRSFGSASRRGARSTREAGLPIPPGHQVRWTSRVMRACPILGIPSKHLTQGELRA
jgi:hypothetical protein